MPLTAGFLHSVERALNRFLQLDPATMQRMAQLEGRCIGIDLENTGIRFYIHPGPQRIVLTDQAEQVDTMLHGTPLAMTRLGLGPDASQSLFSGNVRITGDTETGQTFKEILDRIDIDWEEQLSHITGDLIAHQAGNALRRMRGLLRSAGHTLQQDAGEYLREERRVLPARIEVENLITDIAALRTDTDRLEARIRRLQTRQEPAS